MGPTYWPGGLCGLCFRPLFYLGVLLCEMQGRVLAGYGRYIGIGIHAMITTSVQTFLVLDGSWVESRRTQSESAQRREGGRERARACTTMYRRKRESKSWLSIMAQAQPAIGSAPVDSPCFSSSFSIAYAGIRIGDWGLGIGDRGESVLQPVQPAKSGLDQQHGVSEAVLIVFEDSTTNPKRAS